VANNTVQENTINGILIEDSSEVSVTENQIINNKPDGDGKFGIGINIIKSKVDILNNTILGNSREGIAIQDNSQARIKENQILNTKLDAEDWGGGVAILRNSTAEIRNNTISNNESEGIAIDGSVATISDNTIERNVYQDILVHSSKVTISNNTINENIQVGVLIYVSSEAEITGNIITNTKPLEGYELKVGDGIEIFDGSKATIMNNTITGNARYGIQFPAWGYGIKNPRDSSAEIKGNTINDNKDSGIALWSSRATIIQNNIIKNNGGCGIYADRSTNITSCSGNTVSGNKGGNYCEAARGRCY